VEAGATPGIRRPLGVAPADTENSRHAVPARRWPPEPRSGWSPGTRCGRQVPAQAAWRAGGARSELPYARGAGGELRRPRLSSLRGGDAVPDCRPRSRRPLALSPSSLVPVPRRAGRTAGGAVDCP